MEHPIPDGNPYESPASSQSGTSSALPHDHRAWRLLLVFVTLFFAVRLFNLFWFASWAPDETAIAIAFGLVLPLVALRLVWRGKMAGYWILVVLFGIRGAGGVVTTLYWLSQLGFSREYVVCVLTLGPKHLPTTAICLAAVAWLVFFPSTRRFIRSRNPA